MSGTKWTSAQCAAIDDRGGALLVSAAAGSGKTAVLTERAVRLITDPENPVDADRLLIVTFTNAAAAELRARIGQALLRLSAKEPSNAALRRQRMLLQRAPICTIDAFCLELLHRHFEALDIPPDFAMADPGALAAMRSSALAEALEKAYSDADFCAFADLYGKGRTDRAAGDIILQTYDFLRAMPYYERKLDEFLTPWQRENGFRDTCWHDMLLAAAADTAKTARGLLAAAMADCLADEADEKKKAAMKGKAEADVNARFAEPLERLETARGLFADIEALAEKRDWTGLYDRLSPYVLGMMPSPGMKYMKNRLTGERRAAVRTRADEAEAMFWRVTELVSCSADEAEADRRAALPRLRALFEAVRDFDARLAAKKRERRVLEFSDLEHEALRLLRTENGEPTPLCETVRRSYAAVMVDEYQDTNALQDALYSCLALPGGDDLFLVGDLKQSIYRFRQADPDIFRAKLESWPPLEGNLARPRPAEGQAGCRAVLALDANFRSAPEVVDGINFIFSRLMSPRLGDTAYGEGQRLVCGAPGEYRGSVEAVLLEDGSAEADAEWCARRIEQMIASGELVRDGGSVRRARYEDCCILLSARTNMAAYTEALEAHGIPVYADARENLLEAAHIRPLIALLRVIDNPAQDVCLAAVMLGPLFGFTDDDMVRLRAAQAGDKQEDRKNRPSLYGAVLAAAKADGSDELTAKVRAFCSRLEQLRQLARTAPPDRLFEEIFASTGYLAVLGAMDNGARRREDALRFAAFCSQAGAGGISALVRAVDAAEQAGDIGQESVPGSVRPGCVTVMSIHRSKGLQFPVVILCDTGRHFNAASVRAPVLLHRDCGVGLRLHPEGGDGTYKTAAYTALAEVHMREMRSEQMRLLYVALTRAQDKLIMTMPLGVSKSSDPLARAAMFLEAGAGQALYSQANSFADWLRAALLVHPCGGALRRAAGDLELPFEDTRGSIKISVLKADGEQGTDEAQAGEKAPAQADEKLVERLLKGFGWQYPAACLADIPAKVSVTGIVHKTEQTSLERPAFLSKDGLTAAEMGTALHAFLEHADFAALADARAKGADALAAAVRAESERQTAARLTAPEIAARLDEAKICAFVCGEAFERICRADRVLREYAFITSLPASEVMAGQGVRLPEQAGGQRVLVQGIADLLLVYPDHLELLDYKTDRGKTAEELLRAYRRQLELYALAINRRFAPLRVTYSGIYSFALGRLIKAG